MIFWIYTKSIGVSRSVCIFKMVTFKAVGSCALVVLCLFGIAFYFSGWYDVEGVTYVGVNTNSLVDHRTDVYRIRNEGFVVRRGQTFSLDITTQKRLKDGQKLEFGFEPEEGKQLPIVETKLVAYSVTNGHSYNLEVKTTADGPIGKFEKAVVYISNSKVQNASDPFHLTGPVYIIFNPYNEADETYCPETLRSEMLEHEYGRIYNGWAHDYFHYLWYYAHYDQSTLDAAFYLLSLPEMDQSKIDSASDIATFVSTNLGWYWRNVTDHSQGIVGNVKGLVEGRWSDDLRDYPNGTDPEAWTSTLEIINEWQETGRAAKYGQCYIYGAMQNAVFRTLGLASRQLSAFDARIDATAKFYSDGRKHHVINKYYDHKAKVVKSEGQIWNFHSWTDIYLNNYRGYTGLMAIDGTPPGTPTGPGPLTLIKALDDRFSNTTDTMISTVKAAERNILVNCSSPDMCDMEKVLKFDPKGVRAILTNKPEKEEGSLDITLVYLDREKSAYTKVPHDPWHPDVASNDVTQVSDDTPLDISVDITLSDAENKNVLLLGESAKARVQVTLRRNGEPLDEDVPVTVAMAMDLTNSMGRVVDSLTTVQEQMTLPAGTTEQTAHFTAFADPIRYLRKRSSINDALEVRAIVSTLTATKNPHAVLESQKFRISAPDVHVRVPPLIAAMGNELVGSEFSVMINYENPKTVTPHEVCLSLHTHQLVLSKAINTGATVSKHGEKGTVCKELQSGETMGVEFYVSAPESAGKYTMAVSLAGEGVPHHVQTVQVTVVE